MVEEWHSTGCELSWWVDPTEEQPVVQYCPFCGTNDGLEFVYLRSVRWEGTEENDQ